MLPLSGEAKGAMTSRTAMDCHGMGGQEKVGPTSARKAASPSSALLLLALNLLAALAATRMLMMTDDREEARAKHVRPHPTPFTHPRVFTMSGTPSEAAAAQAEAAAAETALRYASMSTAGDVWP